MPSHDMATCRLCDEVPAEHSRRHWKHEPKAGYWHVIADGPDLMARMPRPAHFITVLAYRPGQDGSPTHYTGPLYFEFDAAHSADALNDLRRCLQMLEFEVGCPLEAIHVWHSGGRGYHVTIPALAIGAEAGHPSLPRIYTAMITRLFPSQIAPTLDRSVYSAGQGRMWRLPNRRRFENGLYKVPLAMREALHTPYDGIEALTHGPRKGIFWPAEDELSPCPGLVELYQDTVAAIEQRPEGHHPHDHAGSASGGDIGVLIDRCAFIRHCRDDAVTLIEPEWYAMVSNVARCQDGPAVVHQLSAPYPNYSPQETDAKIVHALQDTGPHTCVYIQALGFTGCPAGGCGVKAPSALSYDHDPVRRRRRQAEETARRILQKRMNESA